MLKAGVTIELSASDLVGHLNCRHLTELDYQVAQGQTQQPHYHDPVLEILIERGQIHEQQYVDHLAEAGHDIVRIEGGGIFKPQVLQTIEALHAGREIIAQAALTSGPWGGRMDILRRVGAPSALGDWSYEVIDTKLARETKGGTVLQLSLYSDLLSVAQGVTPELMHVVTPGTGFSPESYRTGAFAAYYRYVKRRLEASLQARAATYPDPKEHCDICRWRMSCEGRRRRDDHLCLVAGITKIQTAELQRRGIGTLSALAGVPLPLPWKPERGSRHSYERCREQARVQMEGRETKQPVMEPLPVAPDLGLARLPEPSVGDIFLDLEGDPFAGEGGLEYLFGFVSLDRDGTHTYSGNWAFTREEEARAFRAFVDIVMKRWAQFPDTHIYHYAPYEPAALKRLMGRYALCEDEIDRMLRAGLFVDLYAVVRHGLRAGVESYSIKNLEVFYHFERGVPLEEARKALAHLQGALELEALADVPESARQIVRGYNRDDCFSTLRLRDWLETIRARLIAEGKSIARPTPLDAAPSEEVGAHQQQVAALVSRLTLDVPTDVSTRTAEQQARWILAYTLDWHRREQKSAWWEYFRLAALPPLDLMDERAALSGLTFVGPAGGTAKAPIHRYGFPPQEVELRGGESLHGFGGIKFGKIDAISIAERTVDIKKRQDTAGIHTEAVYAHDSVSTTVLAEALLRLGEYVAQEGLDRGAAYLAARDLLMRRPPRIGGEPLRRAGEGAVEAAVRIAPCLAGGVLAIQGPPGAGKTYTGARMVCELVKAGKRIGITANSHKVIRNLLNAVVQAAQELHMKVQCIQKVADPEDDVAGITFATNNDTVLTALGQSYQVAGGTAWFWARHEAFESIDVLFVDEAAQMSLANVLAVSQACRSLVLLGDPQQLEQPICGSHPDGTDVSALDHLLAGKATIGKGEGLFLEETWRLHPKICAFTSELFYDGRLRSRAGLERLCVNSQTRIRGAGLQFLPIAHEGNQSSSPEEAHRIAGLVTEVLSGGSTWINRDGVEQPLALSDILIIAPYNAQVFELQGRLPQARIGTVDKFQGQEAALVIYSLTTSSYADAPRGMDFLYDLNRLNVATSRAMCLCIVVGSPALFEPECRTPHQMAMANAFCRYLEMAETLSPE